MVNDTINGLFEILGGLFIAASCWRLWKDKRVHGISLLHPLFFNAWGFWNLYFYPTVGCWWSFWGGVGVVTMNTIWVGMMFYYRFRPQPIYKLFDAHSPIRDR